MVYNLPVKINRAFLLKEAEHEYKTTYSYSLSSIEQVIERDCQPEIILNSAKLFNSDSWIYFNTHPYYIVDDVGVYSSLEVSTYIPIEYNEVDGAFSGDVRYSGFASDNITIVKDTSDPDILNRCILTITRTFESGLSSVLRYRYSAPNDIHRIGFVFLYASVTSPYDNRVGVRHYLYQNDHPYNYLSCKIYPVYTYGSDDRWAFVDNPNINEDILIESSSLGIGGYKNIITQTVERSIIT